MGYLYMCTDIANDESEPFSNQINPEELKYKP